MTITQTVDIPASHRPTVDVPREVPEGATARLEVKVFPFAKEGEKPEPPLKLLVGVETPIADSLLGVAANLGSVTLDEIREERLAKYLE
ncbi:MAG: hypothetical protein LBG91_00990 [Treponema sp.]|jgi:hypothetical protein|nr:hypothetical protein [Treponema sp.]